MNETTSMVLLLPRHVRASSSCGMLPIPVDAFRHMHTAKRPIGFVMIVALCVVMSEKPVLVLLPSQVHSLLLSVVNWLCTALHKLVQDILWCNQDLHVARAPTCESW